MAKKCESNKWDGCDNVLKNERLPLLLLGTYLCPHLKPGFSTSEQNARDKMMVDIS